MGASVGFVSTVDGAEAWQTVAPRGGNTTGSKSVESEATAVLLEGFWKSNWNMISFHAFLKVQDGYWKSRRKGSGYGVV